MKKDLILEAMNAFLKRLPDPMLTAKSTITMQKTVGIRTVRLIAQKFKASVGYIWGVHFAEEVGQNESPFYDKTVESQALINKNPTA